MKLVCKSFVFFVAIFGLGLTGKLCFASGSQGNRQLPLSTNSLRDHYAPSFPIYSNQTENNALKGCLKELFKKYFASEELIPSSDGPVCVQQRLPQYTGIFYTEFDLLASNANECTVSSGRNMCQLEASFGDFRFTRARVSADSLFQRPGDGVFSGVIVNERGERLWTWFRYKAYRFNVTDQSGTQENVSCEFNSDWTYVIPGVREAHTYLMIHNTSRQLIHKLTQEPCDEDLGWFMR